MQEVIGKVFLSTIARVETEDSTHYADKFKYYFKIYFFDGGQSPWSLRTDTEVIS